MFLLILLGVISVRSLCDGYFNSVRRAPWQTIFQSQLANGADGPTYEHDRTGAGANLFGPLSDGYGRRPLLLVSMLLFIVSTLFCSFAPDICLFVTCG